jgi:ubiquinone biosynthesis protein UbiJ
MTTTALLAPFEALLNRSLAASTPARALLADLRDRSFAIDVTTPLGGRLLRVRLQTGDARLALTTGEEAADATVSGTPFGLMALLAGRAEGRLTASGVSIAGDAEVAAAFEKLLRFARPDLEAELARIAGDTPAHYATQVVRGLADWGRHAAGAFARNLGEFLTEEGRDLVPRLQLQAFHAEVDQIREGVDRAEARLAILLARHEQRPR